MPLATTAYAACGVRPSVIYNGGYKTTKDNIQLRIGNGGAWQSGLIGGTHTLTRPINPIGDSNQSPTSHRQRLHQIQRTKRLNPLHKSDTAETISYLIPTPSTWASHTVHPPSASQSKKASRLQPGTTSPRRNIKESQLWLEIGQVPWEPRYSTWYHQYITYPIQALTAAILLEEYTITDRGTYLSIPRSLQNQTVIYKVGTDDPADPLLDPAHVLIGRGALNKDMAERFTKWIISPEGQNVVTDFRKKGMQLHTAAPADKTAQY